MVGNVNGIVESMYAAENARTQQSAASGKTGNFSGYLDAALLNYRTGLFTQGLFFFFSGFSFFFCFFLHTAAMR